MRTRWSARIAAAALGVAVLLVVLTTPTQSATIWDTLGSTPGFANFTKAASRSAAFVELLKSPGPVTLFVVENSGVDGANLGALTDNDVSSVLFYHVVPGEVTSDKFSDVNFLATALTDPRFVSLGAGQGQRLMILRDYGAYFVNGYASISRGDQKCDNGVIHVMGSMIWPSITPVTDLAKKLESTAFVDKAAQFYLKSLLDRAGVTVFLPTNEAMAEFPSRDERKVIGYHVATQLYYLGDFRDGQEIKMANNENVRIVRDDRRLVVVGANGDAAVLTVNYNDAFARNGVVYRINKVLLSPSFLDPSIKVEETAAPEGVNSLAPPSLAASSLIVAVVSALATVALL